MVSYVKAKTTTLEIHRKGLSGSPSMRRKVRGEGRQYDL